MRVLFTGGGTGGHIYPALAVAQHLRREDPSVKLLFVGTERGLEHELVPKEGFDLETISSAGLKRRLTPANLRMLLQNLYGFAQALRIICRFRPEVVVGTGGYVTVPVVLAAAFYRIPVLLHEQNALPGLANRWLSRFARRVAVSYEDSARFFPKLKVFVSGNPVREAVWQRGREEGRKNLDIDPAARLVLVFGGSRGARPLTEAAVAAAPALLTQPGNMLLIVTGNADFAKIEEKVCRAGIPAPGKGKMLLRPYLYNMEDALAAADLVVTRAGATTIAEITARGIPAILVPSPYVTANHQEYNARVLVDRGAAIMIREKDLSGRRLAQAVQDLLACPEKRARMAERARALGRREAAETIAAEIKCLAGRQ
ncbi:MAG: UDP-N-acetylglucosamine--N-acetylmuramyl-(pentapeptide) pyrophosphoryl-undecaprenol [Bacillota bacterium]|jgi:UDP-N-acetylglucosamine--N-acetylmuramyl-(pentapeptide) pyrophosphoryl-undecaprenol N-acetylglucosamine transferase|nr:UDP-N-acetylglucosamine--N-acetylmuramyl-(pentapeptide) pyrophosphoryl-undecaprenol [Bacillota bacterium]MDK2855031.1 UDP-N-acetylglucosamine--N-acetylmuramyl-(pentapeptide) pyrophosphoryl-undecaprenol [Bacillota bacterium]MDK2924847.1 UDP-N-acetylglucosamine--N-acetylmuramyl-(pentapeptide) pyrophosphoryl-undecaprenol [Bacillota bacterium]